MKILICTGIYPPDIGGPAVYSKIIGEELAKRGHWVEILTYGDERITNDELRITSIGRKHNILARYFLYFWKVLRLGRKADIIYIQDPVSAGLPAALANIFLRKKMVLKMVGDYAWEQAMQISNFKFQISNLDEFYPFKPKDYPLKIHWLQKIQNWVAERADKIITPSFYLKNILINGWKIDEKKIIVIYNSLPVLNFQFQISDLKNEKFKILSVGRLVPWKGFGTLIEIMKDISGAELEIIGDGPLLENFKFQISNFKLEDRVKLSGRLSHEEVAQKMCSSDLLILNSSYEGLSHVLLETMACGLPAAASRAGGNTELIGENEERGYLFEYNNQEQIKEKINYIISHQEEAREKTKKAKEFIFGFNKEMTINNLENLLRSLF